MEITLGPVLFDWERGELLKFYKEVADMEVDAVYIGEVVCSRRRSLGIDDIKDIASELTGQGKKVYLSTLAVVANEIELERTRELAQLPYALEANDASAIAIGREFGSGLLAGPHITTYNTSDMDFLERMGVTRVVFPVELGERSIAYNATRSKLETEVFAHGKVPLAFSWRCYTSRAYGLEKHNCKFDCRKFPDGMEIKTLDGEPVFNINGTSILSALTYSLIGFTDSLASSGVTALRISPDAKNTADVVSIFRGRLDGHITARDALTKLTDLAELNGTSLCNGWYSHGAGKDYIDGFNEEDIEKRLSR